MGSNRFLIPTAAAVIILACSPMLLTQTRTSEVTQSDEASRAETAGNALVRSSNGAVVQPFLRALNKYAPLVSRNDSYSSKGPGIFQPAPPDHLN